MAEIENSKDLISVLWSGADILRSKMDANEYKDYLLGIVFYKYLSDSYLSKAYDLMNDEKPDSLEEAQEKYLAHYFERLLKVLCLIGLGSFMPIISGIIMCQVWKR